MSLKIISLFSGIGAFEKALKRQNIPYELVHYCEFDKYAAKAYSLIHNEPESKNLGDITKVNVDALPPIDFVCYGFPCQDISVAGKQRGLYNEDGTHTRSGLFFNALEIIEHCKPRFAIAENVKALTSHKFKTQFETILDSLDNAGYNNYWKVLNSKNYGIPQSRERVFIVSIRKDLDNGTFQFPEPIELKLRLRDILEDEVDEKYFLSKEQVSRMTITNPDSEDTEEPQILAPNNFAHKAGDGTATRKRTIKEIVPALQANCGATQASYVLTASDIKPKLVGGIGEINFGKQYRQGNRIYDSNAIAMALMSSPVGNAGGWSYLYKVDEKAEIPLKRGYSVEVGTEKDDTTEIDVIGNYSKSGYQATQIVGKNGVAPTCRENHGQVTGIVVSTDRIIQYACLNNDGWQRQANEVLNAKGISKTVCAQSNNSLIKVKEPATSRVRKLTPKEYFRLQGFDDADIDILVKNGISNAQLYKVAGNSITVNVLEALFNNLIDKDGNFKRGNTNAQSSLYELSI